MNLIKYLFVFTLILLATACKKDKKLTGESTDKLANGILVLNEGLFQLNNASLSWISNLDGSVDNDFFTKKTGRLLGDTGNDLKKYGGKIYIVVNVSSTIEVLNAKTGESIKQISMHNGTVGKQPRTIAFHQGQAYVSCFDGYVDVLDTTSLEITQRIKVGSNPDQMTVAGNQLFVSNTGGLNSPLMDSTVSIIDLNTKTELQKIVVGLNPGSIQVAENGFVYVIARGNYGNVPSRMRRISTVSLQVDKQYNIQASSITKYGGKLLLSTFNYGTNSQGVALFDPALDSVTNQNFIDIHQVQTLYNVQYDANQNLIYVLDAKGYTNTGYVYVYGVTGTLLKSYHVGLNPNSILIL